MKKKALPILILLLGILLLLLPILGAAQPSPIRSPTITQEIPTQSATPWPAITPSLDHPIESAPWPSAALPIPTNPRKLVTLAPDRELP